MPVNTTIQLRKGSSGEWSTTNPVLASGEPGYDITNNLLKIGDGVTDWNGLISLATDLYVYVKNTTGSVLSKGQAVYINGAQGSNPTITLAIASGETTSSKTLGLLKQDLNVNEFGYVVSEGLLEGIDTDGASAAGDPIWLSPSVSGGVVYGVSNKPAAPYHMVFIGYVLRKQQNNGKVYIKPQNGFELQELHNVAVSGVSDGQFLQYNSASGLWVPSSSGNFTNLSINGTGVSISGHSHTTSSIADFNSGVSGLLPVTNIVGGTNISVVPSGSIFTVSVSGSLGLTTEEVDDRVSNLLVAGSGINLNYDDNANTLTVSTSGLQSLLTNPVIGVGTSGYVARWSTTNTISSGVLYDDGTNVGIGTIAPSGKLDIVGNLTFNTFTERVLTNTASGSGVILSIDNGTIHKITLTNNCTFTMPSTTDGKSFTIFLNSGSGNYAASFSGVLWSDSAPPTITTTANKVDILSFISDGTSWYGSYSQNHG